MVPVYLAQFAAQDCTARGPWITQGKLTNCSFPLCLGKEATT